MDSLVSLYRPKVFGEVFGQEHPVRVLSQLIKRGQICRNILLYGSVGSGKTTLARIYGKALNCRATDEDGSPCLRCSSCKEVEQGDPLHFKELDAPLFETLDHFKDHVNSLVSSPTLGHRRLIFVDEAHSIARFKNGYEFLLKMVEEPKPGIAFCFATTAVDQISEALRSRLFEIEIRPLGLGQAADFLRDIAAREGIRHKEGALEVLAGLGKGQPRNLLQALDQVREVGDVTRDQVREIFGIDQSEKLVDYFMVLAEGDFARQTQVISTWNEDLKEKVRLVQLFLLSLYYNDLCSLRLILDPLVDSITASERRPIVSAFKTRLGVAGSVLQFWKRMIELLPIVTSDENEEALLIRLTMFQRFVTDAPCGMAQHQNVQQTFAVPVPQGESAAIRPVLKKPDRKRRRRRGPAAVQNPESLSYDVVRQLFNAASFLLQQYGPRYFNTQITVPAGLFKPNNEKEESKFFSEFYRQLDYWFKRQFDCEFHRLSVLENDEQFGLRAHIIIHVPNEPAKEEHLKKWLHDWRAQQRVEAARELEILVDINKQYSSTARRVSHHWQCVRWLCAGLDRSDERFHALKLKKTQPRTAGIIGKRRRLGTSESLSPKAIREAARCGMEFSYAFDEEAWDRLEEGWELDEYADRVKELEKREKEVAAIKAQYPEGISKATDAKRESKLTELENSWSERDGPRSWRGWWLDEQI